MCLPQPGMDELLAVDAQHLVEVDDGNAEPPESQPCMLLCGLQAGDPDPSLPLRSSGASGGGGRESGARL